MPFKMAVHGGFLVVKWYCKKVFEAGIGYAGAGGWRDYTYKEAKAMVLKPCPRCKQMMQVGPAYCASCAPIAQAELEVKRQEAIARKAKLYNQRRDPKYLAFYRSKDWKMTSRVKLQSVAYKCEAGLAGCQGLATEVHHIKPIQTREGWDLRLEWSNLEAVCVPCHNGRHPEKMRRSSEAGVIDLRTVKR
jgi:5-methylcytosine-specific restriction protein A